MNYILIGSIVVGALLLIVFCKLLLGIVIIPEDSIGLITKKFRFYGGPTDLPSGRIIALNGEPGMQAQYLSPGWHFWYWTWKYDITKKSFCVIPIGKIGTISAKDGESLPEGYILSTKFADCDNFQNAETFLLNGGQKGRQSTIINNGTYKINSFLFDVTICDMTIVAQDKIGIVTTLEGMPLPANEIAGQEVAGHDSFQKPANFISNGGFKGIQSQVIQAGQYTINPWFVQIKEEPMTIVPIGYVGVVNSYVGPDGKDVTGVEFKHGNIVGKGQKGVWNISLDPGKYAINPLTTKVELVPTTNIVLNWADARNESHQLDKNLCTIKVRSKDGFSFNIDVSQIIHIPSIEAPKVIARFGSVSNLVSQVLEPTIGNYFRNSAQNSDAIDFLKTRKERQEEAKKHISGVLETYNVFAVDTLIGDIVPPETLMKTLTDRKIAEEQQITFTTQKSAELKRQDLEKERAIADMQTEVVKADQGVKISEKLAEQEVKKSDGQAKAIKLIADADAEKVTKVGNAQATIISSQGKAEAEVIEAKGKATAQSYELQVKAMGQNNFAQLKIAEQISIGKVKIIPDIIIGDSKSSNALDGLLALELLNKNKMDLSKPEKQITEKSKETTK